MRKIASHFVYWKGLHRLHYLELTDEGKLVAVKPLLEEIAGTEFFDGVLLPVLFDDAVTFKTAHIPFQWHEDPLICRERFAESVLRLYHWKPAGVGDKVMVWSLQLSPAEFGTDHSSGNGYIQRL